MVRIHRRDLETMLCVFSTARAQANNKIMEATTRFVSSPLPFRHATNEVSSRCRIRSAGRSLVVAFQERGSPCSTAISALQLFSRNVKKIPRT